MAWWNWRKQGRTAEAERPARQRYVTLGGRRRIANIPYLLPNDLMEQRRLDFQHYILRYLLKAPYAAPLRSPLSILDVGSGTGRWAIEMATIFPDANVIGVDIADPPAEQTGILGEGVAMLPDNYSFLKANILEGLPFPDNNFEYVHMRFLAGAIPSQQWGGMVRELARVTTRGGWIELTEGSLPRDGGPALTQIIDWGITMSQRFGIEPKFGERIGGFLTEAGLVRIVSREIPGPIGPYGGHVGQMLQTNGLSLMGGMQGPVVSQGIASADDYSAALARLPEEFVRYRAVQPFYVAFGQKP